MRFVLTVLLFAASSASAQPTLFGSAPSPAPHWRAGVDAGLSAPLGGVASLEVERTLRGPFSAGARVLVYDSQRGIPVDDGGGIDGSAAEAFVSAGLRRRFADLRVFGGAGASVIRTYAGGPAPDPEQATPVARGDARALRPHLVGGVGVDLYPVSGVGLGAMVRVAAFDAEPVLSTVSLGVRVRIAR